MNNNQNSLWGSRAKATVIDDPAVPAPIHDTYEIAEIYLQRPVSVQNWTLARWFNEAHDLKDFDLQHAVSAMEAKKIIVRKGFNRLPLEPLESFNVKMHVKGDKK